MAKKNEEIDIDEEIKRISRKTNVDLLKSERTFDNSCLLYTSDAADD